MRRVGATSRWTLDGPSVADCCWVLEPSGGGRRRAGPCPLGTDVSGRRASDVRLQPVRDRAPTRRAIASPSRSSGPRPRWASTRMPVVFPDGSAAPVVTRTSSTWRSFGVQPDVSYLWTDDPPPRFPDPLPPRPERRRSTTSGGRKRIDPGLERCRDGRCPNAGARRPTAGRSLAQVPLPSWTVLVALERSKWLTKWSQPLRSERRRVPGRRDGRAIAFADEGSARARAGRALSITRRRGAEWTSRARLGILLSPDEVQLERGSDDVASGYGSTCLATATCSSASTATRLRLGVTSRACGSRTSERRDVAHGGRRAPGT